MTCTIHKVVWSGPTRYEWIIWDGENIVERSGPIFTTYSAAKRAAVKYASNF